MLRSVIALMAVCRMLAAMGGSIAGTIVDPSGALIPTVAVTAREAGTGAAYRTAADERGAYAFPDLPAGRYGLQVDHSGFVPYGRPGSR